MQKIAFTIYEIIKQALLKDMPKEQILETVEYHVQKVYKECIEELYNKNVINNVIKDLALVQSNIDKMSYSVKNETEQCADTNTFEQETKTDSSVYLTGGIAGLILLLLTLFIINHFHISLPRYFDNRFFAIGLTVSILMIVIGYFTWKAETNHKVKMQLEQLEHVRAKMRDLVNPDRMFDRLGVDIICLQVGQGLLCITDPDQDGLLLAKLAALRQRLTDTLGYIIPNVRIIDSNELQEYEYSIFIRNNVVDTGFVYPKKYMIIANKWEATGKAVPKDIIIAEDPTYKVKAYWVDTDIAIENKDMHAVAPDDVIIQHLQEVLIKSVDDVLSETYIRKYVDKVKEDNAVSTDNLLTKLSYGDIRQVYVNLIREKVSVRDITLLMSRLDNYSRFHKEPDILSERVRKDFSRQISLAHCNDDKKIYAIDFSQELTTKLLECVELQKDLGKTKLLLDKQSEHDLVENVAMKLMEVHKKVNTQPVLLCDDKLRLGLYRLLVRHIPTVVVLGNNEIEQDIKLEIVDTL